VDAVEAVEVLVRELLAGESACPTACPYLAGISWIVTPEVPSRDFSFSSNIE
jgi:hypothetical protein